ncbi:hypothetical protein KDX38_29015 [Pseudomonas sp. CDFA 602]|nr:hypothetical protein [Pseudomonas californiensis]MCD5997570.1 hypothetical protein [Pseudomonas californiensis]MCD6003178.1 hypothetical protein [Pseudomonas californiensis]
MNIVLAGDDAAGGVVVQQLAMIATWLLIETADQIIGRIELEALLGGGLSHGSTLLREPSAVLPDIDLAWLGREVLYRDGEMRLVG